MFSLLTIVFGILTILTFTHVFIARFSSLKAFTIGFKAFAMTTNASFFIFSDLLLHESVFLKNAVVTTFSNNAEFLERVETWTVIFITESFTGALMINFLVIGISLILIFFFFYI